MILEAKNLTKFYSGKPAVDQVSLSLQEGEIFGLTGASGSGKTTLLKLLTHQIRPDKGSCTILNRCDSNWNSSCSIHPCIMTDIFGIYDHLTCLEYLQLSENICSLPSSSISHYFQLLGLEYVISKKICELSKGMKQRLAILKAFLNPPQILFLDDPTGDLNPADASTIHELMRELKSKNVTVFFTTRNIKEAALLCDSVGLLINGMLTACGSPNHVCGQSGFDV